MRFLNLDLDFFLNDIAYGSECYNGRLSPEYQPWSVSRVRRFLEERCGLAHDTPVPGRTVENHDGVFDFWRELIECGGLPIPFEVIHIDAHPDLSVRGGLYLTSEVLHIDPECSPALLLREQIHAGNYLTFAIACGWIASLVWVSLRKYLKDLPPWSSAPASHFIRLKKTRSEDSPLRDLPVAERVPDIPFRILPWHQFKTNVAFDYMALSKSPNFTPPQSDALISVVEGYIRQI